MQPQEFNTSSDMYEGDYHRSSGKKTIGFACRFKAARQLSVRQLLFIQGIQIVMFLKVIAMLITLPHAGRVIMGTPKMLNF